MRANACDVIEYVPLVLDGQPLDHSAFGQSCSDSVSLAVVSCGCGHHPSLGDGCSNEVSRFGPRAVVILHIGVAEKVF